jgi:hypothetical protein
MMLFYVLGGALVGIVVGQVFPPGYIFWFAVGALSGWVSHRVFSRRYF